VTWFGATGLAIINVQKEAVFCIYRRNAGELKTDNFGHQIRYRHRYPQQRPCRTTEPQTSEPPNQRNNLTPLNVIIGPPSPSCRSYKPKAPNPSPSPLASLAAPPPPLSSNVPFPLSPSLFLLPHPPSPAPALAPAPAPTPPLLPHHAHAPAPLHLVQRSTPARDTHRIPAAHPRPHRAAPGQPHPRPARPSERHWDRCRGPQGKGGR